MDRRCQLCGVLQEPLKLCSNCKTAFYCSKEHQVKHWKRHKTYCRLQAKKLNQEATDKTASGTETTTTTTTTTTTSPEQMVNADGEPLSPSNRSQHYNNNVITLSKKVTQTSPISAKTPPRSELPARPQQSNTETAAMSASGAVLTSGPSSNVITTSFLRKKYGVRSIEDVHATITRIVEDLNDFGVSVVDNFYGDERGRRVFGEVLQLHRAGGFSDGQLVANPGDENTQKIIRSDQIRWVDGREPSCTEIGKLLKLIDSLVMKANKTPNNGQLGKARINGRTKAMVACYPGNGTHYVKHVDNPNKDGRCITSIYYLNQDWNIKEFGGLLRIFPTCWSDKVADIEPVFDRLLFFWSDRRNPHEVQPAFRTRYAITLWYFDDLERRENKNKSNEGKAAKSPAFEEKLDSAR